MSERKDVLSLFLAVATLLAYAWSARAPGTGRAALALPFVTAAAFTLFRLELVLRRGGTIELYARRERNREEDRGGRRPEPWFPADSWPGPRGLLAGGDIALESAGDTGGARSAQAGAERHPPIPLTVAIRGPEAPSTSAG